MHSFKRIVCGIFLLVSLVVTGCIYNTGCGNLPARITRSDQVAAPMEAGMLLTAETHNGSVTVTGAEDSECRLTAEVELWARTDEEAARLLPQVKIDLVRSDGRMVVKIDRPSELENIRCVCHWILPCPMTAGCLSNRIMAGFRLRTSKGI